MKVVKDARASGTPVLVLDGGDALFKSPVTSLLAAPGARERAEVIAAAYGEALDAFVPGELDVVAGTDAFEALARKHHLQVLAANLVNARNERVFDAFMVKQLGEISVLVVGAVSPSAWPAGQPLRATEPVQALRDALAEAQRKGPPYHVAMLVAHGTEDEVKDWVKAIPGFSAVMTSHTGQLYFQPHNVECAPGPVKEALLFGASKEGKYLARMQAVYVPGERTFQGGEGRARTRYALETAEKKLQTSPGNPAAQAERNAAADALAAQDRHSHADFQALPVDLALPEDPAVKKVVDALEARLAATEAALADRGAEVDKLPDTGPFGTVKACALCHVEEAALWQASGHGRALVGLKAGTHPADKECVACHATGFQAAGGFTKAASAGPLGAVQCEACHEPARVHAQLGRTGSVVRTPPEGSCRKCHTPEASPKFQFPAYRERIRHWLGP